MTHLITGCSGFIGSHFIDYLSQKGEKIYGLDFKKPIVASRLFRFHKIDILNRERVKKLIQKIEPDYIFHLAAQSLIPQSWEDPGQTLATNFLGTIDVLEGARVASKKPRIIIFGSSAEYGSYENKPLKENTPLKATSPYGASKVMEEMVGNFYGHTFNLEVITVRPFAVVGPGKKGDAFSDFARRIIACEKGKSQKLVIGNLKAVRDFIDVREVAKAIFLVAKKGKPGEAYNICRGKGIRLDKLLKLMTSKSKVTLSPVQDPKKLRKIDEPTIIGNPSKLTHLGFKPTIALEKTIEETLEWWRKQPIT